MRQLDIYGIQLHWSLHILICLGPMFHPTTRIGASKAGLHVLRVIILLGGYLSNLCRLTGGQNISMIGPGLVD